MKKNKIKTKSAAKKRFSVTSTGKIKRRRVGTKHLLEHVSSRKKRNKRMDVNVSKSDIKKISKMLPGII